MILNLAVSQNPWTKQYSMKHIHSDRVCQPQFWKVIPNVYRRELPLPIPIKSMLPLPIPIKDMLPLPIPIKDMLTLPLLISHLGSFVQGYLSLRGNSPKDVLSWWVVIRRVFALVVVTQHRKRYLSRGNSNML